MSCNRDNVTWQAPDGTWSIGFWRFEYTLDPEHKDFDHEWSTEYYDDAFWFCSTGHYSPEAAMDAYRKEEPNPVTTYIVRPWTDAGAEKAIARYEALAAKFKAENGPNTSIPCP
ncbi:hypothetical protein [Streptomyces javensis]|uniref:Uncharacterized protein n=1 Tax=Streptomyces javensis TaxID=114698 RepID=A0ABS0R6M1_9ACTN|nr:hypothetical protein [Streptomyces javensis]MBI0313040.1 hypothetical protein [Streptomyces javensis]